MQRVTTAKRERAISRLMAGYRPDDTAHTFNEHPSIMYRLQERFIVTGDHGKTRLPYWSHPSGYSTPYNPK